MIFKRRLKIINKRILLASLFGAVLIAGCQNEDSGEEGAADAAPQETTEQEAQDTEQADQASTAVDAEEEENMQESDTEAEEEQAEFEYTVNPDTYAIEPLENSGADPEVALLTYDDAPDGHAVEIAEILAERDAPAIFFVNGMYLESEEGKEALSTIHEMGFEIGNHTETHPSLPDIAPEAQREEIVATSDRIEEITDERPRFFRAPFGQNTAESAQIAGEEGMVLMNWTYGYDWEAEYQEPAALADVMVNTEFLNHGANLLMHDRAWTRDASADIIDGLRDKGYTLADPALIESPDREGNVE